MQQGKLDDALTTVNECVLVASATRDSRMQAQALVQRGLIAEALEHGGLARTSYEEAQHLFEKAHDGEGVIDPALGWDRYWQGRESSMQDWPCCSRHIKMRNSSRF